MRRSTAAFAAAFAIILTTVLAAVPAAAQPAEDPARSTPLRESELPEANFAFAHRLGTGIYEISGRTVQVYSLPFERRLRERDDERAGLVLTLPVTLGADGGLMLDAQDLGPLVKEVNSSPGLQGIETTTRQDVAGMINEHQEKHAEPGQTRTKGRG